MAFLQVLGYERDVRYGVCLCASIRASFFHPMAMTCIMVWGKRGVGGGGKELGGRLTSVL